MVQPMESAGVDDRGTGFEAALNALPIQRLRAVFRVRLRADSRVSAASRRPVLGNRDMRSRTRAIVALHDPIPAGLGKSHEAPKSSKRIGMRAKLNHSVPIFETPHPKQIGRASCRERV